MQNGFANGLWKQALKTGVAAVTAVLITNFADPGQVVFSWLWFRHVLIGCTSVFIFNEARYWYNWSTSTTSEEKQ
jgi:hypothetical protein